MRLRRQARAEKIRGDRQRFDVFRRESFGQLCRRGFVGARLRCGAPLRIVTFLSGSSAAGRGDASEEHWGIEGATPGYRSATTHRWYGWRSLVSLTIRGNANLLP